MPRNRGRSAGKIRVLPVKKRIEDEETQSLK